MVVLHILPTEMILNEDVLISAASSYVTKCMKFHSLACLPQVACDWWLAPGRFRVQLTLVSRSVSEIWLFHDLADVTMEDRYCFIKRKCKFSDILSRQNLIFLSAIFKTCCYNSSQKSLATPMNIQLRLFWARLSLIGLRCFLIDWCKRKVKNGK